MKKILFVILFTSFLLSGCSSANNTSPQNQEVAETPNATSEDRLLENNMLESFIGEWIVGKLSVTPRNGLVSDEYAKQNSDIVGKRLSISHNGVSFETQLFSVSKVEMCDEERLMSLFNIPLGDATRICGGKVLEDTLTTTGHPINLVSLYTNDGKTHINLVILNDNTLMLWVGETYEYIGFYELSRIKD